MVVGQLDSYMQHNEAKPSFHIIDNNKVKTNQKKCKNYQKKKKQQVFVTLGRQWFLRYDTKVHMTKETVDKLNFCVEDDTLKKVKRKPIQLEKISTNISNKKLGFRICEYLLNMSPVSLKEATWREAAAGILTSAVVSNHKNHYSRAPQGLVTCTGAPSLGHQSALPEGSLSLEVDFTDQSGAGHMLDIEIEETRQWDEPGPQGVEGTVARHSCNLEQVRSALCTATRCGESSEHGSWVLVYTGWAEPHGSETAMALLSLFRCFRPSWVAPVGAPRLEAHSSPCTS